MTDDETGMMLLGHRYYIPLFGRFLNQDPIGQEGGLNLYEYAQNNPLKRVDPQGLDSAVILKGQTHGYLDRKTQKLIMDHVNSTLRKNGYDQITVLDHSVSENALVEALKKLMVSFT